MGLRGRARDPHDWQQPHVKNGDAIGYLRHRYIHPRAWTPTEPCVPNVADDADDLPDRVGLVIGPDAAADDQMIVERIPCRPKSTSHLLIDDHDARRTGIVSFVEVPAAEDGDPE